MTIQALAHRPDRTHSPFAFVGQHADAILVALVALNLVPIWAFTYFPSLDGPAHISLTWWLVHYDEPQLSVVREFLEPNLQLFPNYLIFLILYPLMHVVPPLVAEKLLISLYAVLLPLALRYAMTGASPQARGLAVVGCVMTFHTLLMLGFYNTSFAIPVFLLAIGFWLRRRHRRDWRTLAGYAAISIVAYVTHLSAVAASCLAIFFATVGLAACDWRSGGLKAAWQRLVTHGLWPALGFGPALLLCVPEPMRRGSDVAVDGLTGIDVPDLNRIIGLFRLDVVVGHDIREVAVSVGLAAALGIAAFWGVRRGGRWVNAGLFCFAGFTALYLITPFRFDVGWMPTRLMPYAIAGFLLWIAGMVGGMSEEWRLRTTGLVVVCALALTIVGTGLRMDRWRDINDLIGEYTSGSHLIEPNSTLLALRMTREIEGRRPSDLVELMLQTPGYIAVDRGVVDLRHFQAKTGRFPIVFREDVNPYEFLATNIQIVHDPSAIVPSDYTGITGQTVDYILLWGGADALPPDSPLARDLEGRYELIHVSPSRGLARLYRLRDAQPG